MAINLPILLTGFGPFKKYKVNPAEIVSLKLNREKILDEEIISYTLPVSYRKVIKKVQEIIMQHKPRVFIGLGLAGGRPNITLERVAINIMDTTSPDIDGYKPSDEKIFQDGPAAYFSTLPIKQIVNELRNNGIPAMISNSAGTYVCNTLIYTALYTIAKNKLETLAGFMHLPYLPEQVLDKSQPSMSLDIMLKAVKIAFEVALRSFK